MKSMKRRRVLVATCLTEGACTVLDHAHESAIPCRCHCHGFLRRLWARIAGERAAEVREPEPVPGKSGWEPPSSKPKIDEAGPERNYPQCERCGFSHPPVESIAGFCCVCGKRPARLPYGWCLSCTEKAVEGPPDAA